MRPREPADRPAMREAVRALACGVSLALSSGWAMAQQSPPASPQPSEQHAGEAEREFERIRKLESAARTARGEEKAERQREAARRYQALRRRFPAARELAADADYRAARLLEAAGDLDEACAAFRRLASADARAEWRSRAWLELAHIHRRAGRLLEAVDAYLRAASVDGAPPRTRDDATVWAGKTQVARGEIEQARRWFAWIAERSADAYLRIRAYDEWALSFVSLGDLEGAAGVLARCRDALNPIAFEETPRGKRVLRALERMRCINALERAVARRRSERSKSTGAAR